MKCTWLVLICFYNFAVFGLSLVTFILTNSFVNKTQAITLPLAPKATAELHDVLLPPMEAMQALVLIFDGLVALYYVFQWPVWDGLKARFSTQYETKVMEKPDCSSLVLNVLFVFLSKVSLNF